VAVLARKSLPAAFNVQAHVLLLSPPLLTIRFVTAALMAFKAVVSGGRPGLLNYLQSNESIIPCHDSSPECYPCSYDETQCGLNVGILYCNFYGIGCTNGRQVRCAGGGIMLAM
jgi:hypothetical protein